MSHKEIVSVGPKSPRHSSNEHPQNTDRGFGIMNGTKSGDRGDVKDDSEASARTRERDSCERLQGQTGQFEFHKGQTLKLIYAC